MRVRAPSTELILWSCKAWNVIPVAQSGRHGGQQLGRRPTLSRVCWAGDWCGAALSRSRIIIVLEALGVGAIPVARDQQEGVSTDAVIDARSAATYRRPGFLVCSSGSEVCAS